MGICGAQKRSGAGKLAPVNSWVDLFIHGLGASEIPLPDRVPKGYCSSINVHPRRVQTHNLNVARDRDGDWMRGEGVVAQQGMCLERCLPLHSPGIESLFSILCACSTQLNR